MPSAVQIVPKYNFSYVETHITDNTEVKDPNKVDVDNSYRSIHVFRSGKGIDNKVVKKKKTSDLKDTFGMTDYERYGQPLMMPYATLGGREDIDNVSTENLSTAYCMRIMPFDATYANDGLYIYYRVADANITEIQIDENGDIMYDEDGITPSVVTKSKKMFQVMFRHMHFAPELDPATNKVVENGSTGVHTLADLEASVKAAAEDIASIDDMPNWKCLPLMYVNTVGRGEYGNGYRYTIARDSEYEKDTDIKMYTINFIANDSDGEAVQYCVGSLVTEIVDKKATLINNVLENYEDGSYPVNVFVYEDTMIKLHEEYSKFLTDLAQEDPTLSVSIPALKEFDPFFGMQLGSDEKCEFFQVLGADEEGYPIPDDAHAVDLADPLGIEIDGGYDGSFATTINSDGTKSYGPLQLMTTDMYKDAVRKGITHLRVGEATVEDYVYALAFNGYMDKAILSNRRVPATYLLDANYSYPTKISFAKWVKARGECFAYIDTGLWYDSFSSNVLRILKKNYTQNQLFYNSKNEAPMFGVYGHKWKVDDPFTARKVWVTPTYFIAQSLPAHFKENGIQTAFANEYAIITGAAKKSITPVIDECAADMDLKQTLKDMNINYVESRDETTFTLGSQNSFNRITSDLSEISNCHIAFWYKRNVQEDLQKHHYNFADANDRASFQRVEAAKYEKYSGTLVSSFAITFDMSPYELERQILHCYVALVMRTLHIRSLLEIDINRRSL